MSKPKKLPHLRNIPLSTYIKFLENEGFKCNRTKGGHIHYTKSGIGRPLTLQSHITPVPEFIIKQHLRYMNMSPDECMKRLGEL